MGKDPVETQPEPQDYENIIIPNWRDAVPITDSILLNKIKHSKNVGIAYLFICESIKNGKGKIKAKDLGDVLKVSDSYAYQLLRDVFVRLGYLKKISTGKGKYTRVFFIPAIEFNGIIREEFVKEADKYCY